jgi:seryl-tRNA synthetase
VRGAKASSTAERTYKAPSLEELKQETEKANKEIKTSMSDAQSGASEMQEEISEIEKMLTEKKNLDWNDKKKIEDLLEKGKKLQEEVKRPSIKT